MSAPLSPKFHGAWLGAGTAAAISNVIVGLLQSYVTHKALPAADVQLIYTLVGVALAGFGAWVMPSGKPAATVVNLPPAEPHSNVAVAGSAGSYAGSAGSGPGGGGAGIMPTTSAGTSSTGGAAGSNR